MDMPPGPGRPTTLTEQLGRSIAGAIAAGNYAETAAAVNGISKDTFYRWLKLGARESRRLAEAYERGEEAEIDPSMEIYVSFSDSVQKAIELANLRDLNVIDKTAQGGLDEGWETIVTKKMPVVLENGTTLRDANGAVVFTQEETRTVRIGKTLPVWTAAAWRLERRDPGRFGRRIAAEVSGPGGAPLIPLASIRAALAEVDGVDPDKLDVGTAERATTDAGSGQIKRLPGGGSLEELPPEAG